MSIQKTQGTPGSMPKSVGDLLNGLPPRKIKVRDRLYPIYCRHYEDPTFMALRKAVRKEDTVEGKFEADDQQAASILREAAKIKDSPDYDLVIGDMKLVKLAVALRDLEKYLEISRKKRIEEFEKSLASGAAAGDVHNDSEEELDEPSSIFG